LSDAAANQFLNLLAFWRAAKVEISEAATQVIADPLFLDPLLETIETERSASKFYCDKVVRILSELRPDILYPYFERISSHLDIHNSFILWGTIITLANLAIVDTDSRFEAIRDRYFGLIRSGSMVTAANVISNAWKIVERFPAWEPEISRWIMDVDTMIFLYKGEPSPECNSILSGDALDCFSHYFFYSQCKKEMQAFASRNAANARLAVARKARAFLLAHPQ